tara:strand:+ start:1291 stop:2481 length:1191 start_codon:yes stop_codon:yes gene_type:complete
VIFQTLDDKGECFGIYADGELHFEEVPSNISATWAYSPVCYGRDIQFAQIYCGGKSLREVCPDSCAEDYERVSRKMKSFLKSFHLSKINLSENCFYDIVPSRFLLEFYDVKSQICQHILDSYEKPENHNFLSKIMEMTHGISSQPFTVDKSVLDKMLTDPAALSLRQKLSESSVQYARYNTFGTVTGRLTTYRNSFPILTLGKKFREIVKPKNDVLVEIDFNAAELRTLLGLSGHSQPSGDIHTWNMSEIFSEVDITREEAKKKIFSWLYNPNSLNKRAEKFYLRDELVEKYYHQGVVTTPMGRRVAAEGRTALNYLIQSTTSDIFLNSAYKVWQSLKDSDSEVRFLVHDSVLLDVKMSDMPMIKKLVGDFSQTPLGRYEVGVSVGDSYGYMRKLK